SHVRDETYQAALACLVDAIHAQPFTKIWGDGDTSSSDGQFFRAGGHGEARADYNTKYGSEPGVKFYTHVSDRYAPFYSKVIAANASEAAHVLDGLMHHESSIDIREHYTDTAGAIDHVFGLCHLLGLRFAPRIRDLADRRLYVVDARTTYKALPPVIGGTIDLRVIAESWDEILRLAASIKAGTVTPSAILRRLAAYPRQNALAKALREIGRLERTLFTLDWISDPGLRRRTNAGLNKGEARNALARAVFFHRLGEIRDRTFENQRYRASGLNLAVAAITLWNTLYLGRAVDQLRSQGEVIDDALLAHIAPLGWEHITFNGDYVWPTEPLQNAFRPLRNPRSAFLDPASRTVWGRFCLRQGKSWKGGGKCDLKPFAAVQRVRRPPGRGAARQPEASLAWVAATSLVKRRQQMLKPCVSLDIFLPAEAFGLWNPGAASRRPPEARSLRLDRGPGAGQRHGKDRQGTCEVPLASMGATSRNWERRPINCSRPDGDLRAGRERFGE